MPAQSVGKPSPDVVKQLDDYKTQLAKLRVELTREQMNAKWRIHDLANQVQNLTKQLQSAHAENNAKDQMLQSLVDPIGPDSEIGMRIQSLEAKLSTLREAAQLRLLATTTGEVTLSECLLRGALAASKDDCYPEHEDMGTV